MNSHTAKKSAEGVEGSSFLLPSPVEFCESCGEEITHTWVGDNISFLFRHLGMTKPGWHPDPCGCHAEGEKNESAIIVSGIRSRFIGKSFKDFIVMNEEQVVIRDAVKVFAREFRDVNRMGTWMLFMGTPGTGKSLLACIVTQEVIKGGGFGAACQTLGNVQTCKGVPAPGFTKA